MGVAGGSAQDQATRARAAAQVLERKAAYAARRADQFTRGSEGEAAVAHALAELTADGHHLLHDRRMPTGGNIDHLLIGPLGVYVIDAKAWNGVVTAAEGVLRCNGRRRQDAVEGMLRQVAEVRASLAANGHGDVRVRGVLALATPADEQPIVRVDDVSVVPLRELVPGLRGRQGPVDSAAAESILRTLSAVFPPADAKAELPAPLPPEDRDSRFDKFTRTLFVDSWSKAGKRRLYLKDGAGTALGWKDLNDGSIAVTHQPDDELVRAVLAHADAVGLHLDCSRLPKIPAAVAGGRLMSLTGLRTVFLIGHRWRRGAQDRLYGTWASTNEGKADLGYVDLLTGQLHPSNDRPVAKDRDVPERLLGALLARRPTA